MQQNYPYYSVHTTSDDIAGKQRYLSRIYGFMALGLLITFAVALAVSQLFPQIVYQPMLLMLLLIAELVVVWSFSRRLLTASYQSVLSMFFIYSVLNGITMSSIFLYFDISTIYLSFLTSSVAFGIMALVGHTTKRDLSPLRGILFGGLIALILMTLLGTLLRSTGLEILICCIGIVLFLGLTAYDSQKLLQMYDSAALTGMSQKLAVYGALQLYLDFINLFQYVLLLFGCRRND